MAGFTNKGKFRMFESYLRGASAPANFWLALVTSATAPVADTNTLSQLTQIANGQGYDATAGGLSIARNSTDWDVCTEDDANDRVYIQLKDITWTASGGNLPASGNGARYVVLCDANATVGSREVLAYWDLVSDRTVSDGQTLTLQNCELRGSES